MATRCSRSGAADFDGSNYGELELGRFLRPAYTMADPAKLAGCKEIPVVDPKLPLPKKTSRR